MDNYSIYHPDVYAGRKTLKDETDRAILKIQKMMGSEVLNNVADIYSSERTFFDCLENEKITIESLQNFLENAEKHKPQHVDKLTYDFVLKMITSDANTLGLIRMCHAFYTNPSSKIYKVSPLFAKALAKIKDKIQFDLLPDSFCGFIPLPKGVFKDYIGENIIGAYIQLSECGISTKYRDYIEDLKKGVAGSPFEILKTGSAGNPFRYDEIVVSKEFGKVLEVGITIENSKHKSTDIMVYKVTVQEGDNLSDLVSQLRKNAAGKPLSFAVSAAPDEVNKNEREFLSFIVNTICYVNSLEPDVSVFKPVHLRSSRERINMQRNFEEDDSSYPTVFVSWNYGKDRTYTVDSTWVDAHLVWQRCGPGFREKKLIMRSGHERHYKNVREEEDQQTEKANETTEVRKNKKESST